MSRENCKRPIDLLRDNQPCNAMRQSHRTKREQKRSSVARCFRPAVRRTNREQNMLHALISSRPNPFRQLLRGHLTTAAVEQNHRNRCSSLLAFQPLEQCIFAPESLSTAPRQRTTATEIGLNQLLDSVFCRAFCRTSSGHVSQSDLHALQDNPPRENFDLPRPNEESCLEIRNHAQPAVLKTLFLDQVGSSKTGNSAHNWIFLAFIYEISYFLETRPKLTPLLKYLSFQQHAHF